MTAIQMPGRRYDQVLETGIRPFDISRDLRAVAELISVAFANELDDRGSAALREMRAMSYFGNLLGILNRSTGEFNDLLNGFVWVDRGTVVGNITVQRADKYGSRWQIANVAVAPKYRGRGISRQLMEAAMEHAAQCGGLWVVLQVYAGNAVARRLYASMDFEEVGGTVELRAPRVPAMPKVKPHPFIKRFAPSDWRPLYELANHQLGAQAQWWRAIRRAEFQPSFEQQMGEWLWQAVGRQTIFRRAIQVSPRFEAALILTARRWHGEHQIQLWVRPEHYGVYEAPLVEWVLSTLQDYPRWPVRISLNTSHTAGVTLLEQYGFQQQQTLLTLRKRLASDIEQPE
ncbi:MAG: GNAT family N-acetyltransferase [Caldilineaceae bacterium]|nr:GNAT family N-acetyltransferase [Caldilineaceae bacterium]